jgi:hypothetical protein
MNTQALRDTARALVADDRARYNRAARRGEYNAALERC